MLEGTYSRNGIRSALTPLYWQTHHALCIRKLWFLLAYFVLASCLDVQLRLEYITLTPWLLIDHSPLMRRNLNVLDLKPERWKFNLTSTCNISIVIVAVKTFLNVEILIAFVLHPQRMWKVMQSGKFTWHFYFRAKINKSVSTSRLDAISSNVYGLQPERRFVSVWDRWQCRILRSYLECLSFWQSVPSNLVFWKCHKGYSPCIPMGSPPYTICQMMLTFIEVPQAKLYYQKVWQGNNLLRRTGSYTVEFEIFPWIYIVGHFKNMSFRCSGHPGNQSFCILQNMFSLIN